MWQATSWTEGGPIKTKQRENPKSKVEKTKQGQKLQVKLAQKVQLKIKGRGPHNGHVI